MSRHVYVSEVRHNDLPGVSASPPSGTQSPESDTVPSQGAVPRHPGTIACLGHFPTQSRAAEGPSQSPDSYRQLHRTNLERQVSICTDPHLHPNPSAVCPPVITVTAPPSTGDYQTCHHYSMSIPTVL